MRYRVDIKLVDGTTEYFDTFESESYAYYHISLAKCSPYSMYATEKYDGAIWEVTKEV